MACTSCHTGHGSRFNNNLVKGQPALCLDCHRGVARFWTAGVAHEPAIQDCSLCHLHHGAAFPGLLHEDRTAICVGCHDSQDGGFLNAHQGIKPGPASCLGCHDPHGGPDKSLLYPVIHTPFEKGDCRPCHGGRAR
jgi:predicted CXXCH cytochrome family protein